MLDGKFALGCGPVTVYPYIYIYVFQCMLERTDAITNEVLEPTSFALTYPTVPISPGLSPLLITSWPAQEQLYCASRTFYCTYCQKLYVYRSVSSSDCMANSSKLGSEVTLSALSVH